MTNRSPLTAYKQRPFQGLLNKDRNAVHYKDNMAQFSMVCANNEHRAVINQILHWLEPSADTLTKTN